MKNLQTIQKKILRDFYDGRKGLAANIAVNMASYV
jgi:hypothetical protein